MNSALQSQQTFTHENFEDLANILLNRTLIQVTAQENVFYRICEIEFYLKSETHNDEYTHCSTQQSTYGFWYLHRYKTGTCKEGTYKGLDITLGSPSAFFGILIRSIQKFDIGTMSNIDALIEGPCLSVNELMKYFGVNTAKEFNQIIGCGPILDNVLTFIDLELPQIKLKKGPRIGLSDKYPDYKERNYRFVCGNVKKQKKTLVEV